MTGTQADILASLDDLAGETDEEKLAWLAAFYGAINDLLIAHDIWKMIGDDPADAAEFIGYHGLEPMPNWREES